MRKGGIAVRVSGPEGLIDALRPRLAGIEATVAFAAESGATDLAVAFNDTVIRTAIAAWVARLPTRRARPPVTDEPAHEIIIVRRHEEEEHAAHSSAWKVAHADFMTAMMAFFLIMWLINVTDDEQRKGISQYFNPIHLSQGSTDLKGLNAPDPSNTSKSGRKGPSETPSPTDINPVQLTAGGAPPPDVKALTNTGATAAKPSAAASGAAAAAAAAAAALAGPGAGAGGAAAGAGALAGTAPAGTGGPGSGQGAASGAGFQDPYAALANLSAVPGATAATSPDVVAGDSRPVGTAGGAAIRDPFDPIYWQLAQSPPARTADPGAPGTAVAALTSAAPDAAAPATAAPSPTPRPAKSSDGAAAAATAVPATPATSPPPVATTPPAAIVADVSAAATDSSVTSQTVSAAQAVAHQMTSSAQPIIAAGAAPDLTVKATAEGTLISLTDDAAYSMFPVGSATADAKVAALMAKIADALKAQSGDVVIRGYTDARPFHGADDDNWRLSAARAHAAYALLTAAGLPEARVVAIEGHADRDLLKPGEPLAAENRRIEILLKVAE